MITIIGCFSQNPLKVGPLFSEKFRPQFHYTAPLNSLGDVEGLVYYKGEYHMHHIWNSKGNDWGNVNYKSRFNSLGTSWAFYNSKKSC